MARSMALAAMLFAAMACTPAERAPYTAPAPVIPLPGLTLPATPGDTPLPTSFIGIVMMPEAIMGLTGPGQPLQDIGFDRSKEPLIHEMFDFLDATRAEAPEDTPVVWFIDKRVPLERISRAIHTGTRQEVETFWLASGTAQQVTIRAILPPRFSAPGRRKIPEHYLADLRLEIRPITVTTIAEPRPVGDRPGLASLDARFAPEDVPITLAGGDRCQWSSTQGVRAIGQALCDLIKEPYGLTVDIDPSISYPRLIEQLAADPRPAQCMAGPPRLGRRLDHDRAACDDAIAVNTVLTHFVTRTKALVQGQHPLDDGLPETMTTTDIKRGVATARKDALACGARHGARSGETVNIRVEVGGVNGRVLSAKALHEHAKTPLGRCVTAHIKKARFPYFRQKSMSFQLPVKM